MTTPGKVIRMKWITREYVQQNPDTYFVFGDNMAGQGLGGQAGAMRGEPNAIGVPTKLTPSMREGAFFKDSDLTDIRISSAIVSAFYEITNRLKAGYNVVIPTDGLGTGLSQLPTRAPLIAKFIDIAISNLEISYPNDEVSVRVAS